MNTKIVELRMAIQALPTDNKNIQLAVKAEVFRLAEELNKIIELLQAENTRVFPGEE